MSSQRTADYIIPRSLLWPSRAPAAATICGDPRFQQTSEFLNIYLHAWDGPKTWYRTLLPSYLLHLFFKRYRLALDGICEVHKTEKFDRIYAPPPPPQSEPAQR